MDRRDFVRASAVGMSLATGLPLRVAVPGRRLVERWSWVMGQSVHILLFAENDDQGLEAASRALAELRRIEGALSRFDDASDLCELNRQAGRRPVQIGADLMAVLAAGTRIKAASAGAFNLAVEPLMRAWGFRDSRRAPPSEQELREACDTLAAAEIRLAGDRAFLPSASTQLDSGGIGVGYGLDRAGAVLRSAGISQALIDISGDCLALGAPPGETGWAVDIASPGDRGGIDRTFSLRDQGLATSSNLESIIQLGAIIAGHVMDPRTGHPASRERQSTVIAPRAIEADGFSTAALITGNPGPGTIFAAAPRKASR